MGLHCLENKCSVDMGASCYSTSVEQNKQPLDSIANFQYYGHEELPPEVQKAFPKAIMFDLMLISCMRATKWNEGCSAGDQGPNGTHKCHTESIERCIWT